MTFQKVSNKFQKQFVRVREFIRTKSINYLLIDFLIFLGVCLQS